ncbi:MAG: DUF2470 domain-containing protein [Pseudomonadota bacterium]
MVARVGIATDNNGFPVFPVSALSGRDRQLEEDARVSLLLGEPGRGDPLAHARLSLEGVARRLEGDDAERARHRYLARHPKASVWIDFSDMSLWRIAPTGASYIAGFGRAYELTAEDVHTSFNDWPGWYRMEPGAVAHMNDDHRDATALYATVLCGAPEGDWRITGLDPEGVDMALGDDHRRVQFEGALSDASALRPALVALVKTARKRVSRPVPDGSRAAPRS